jgi:hypothetical protein
MRHAGSVRVAELVIPGFFGSSRKCVLFTDISEYQALHGFETIEI